MAKMRKRKIGECFICGVELQGKDAIPQEGALLPKALPIPGPGKGSGDVMACVDHPGVLKAYLDSGAEKMLNQVKQAIDKAMRELEAEE